MANITVKDILFCTEGKLLAGEESTVVENFSITLLRPGLICQRITQGLMGMQILKH